MMTRFGAMSRSFKDAETMLRDYFLISESAPQIRRVTEYVGQKAYEDLKEKANTTYENIVELSKIKESPKVKELTMVIEFDGSMIRKLQEQSKGTEWKELKLGCIFIKNKIGKVIQKEYISYFGEAEEFKKFLFHLAVKMEYINMEKVVVIADGAHWIWNICQELFPNAVEILDFFHCKENVCEYYKALYPDNEKRALQDAKKIMKKIEKEVKIETIIKQIPIIENVSTGIVNLPNYLMYHKNRIKYKTFKKENFDIGSGVIESGNKNVIQHRMKQTGMMWKKENIDAMCTLRCKIESNCWNDIIQIIQDLCPVLI